MLCILVRVIQYLKECLCGPMVRPTSIHKDYNFWSEKSGFLCTKVCSNVEQTVNLLNYNRKKNYTVRG